MLREGKYVDLWSIVHFLFGVLFVFVANFFGLAFLQALIILTVITAVWELIELISGKAKEFFSNRITDVVFADIGFVFMYFLLLINNIEEEMYAIIFLLIAAIFIILNINGWNNHIKRMERNKDI